MLETIITLDLVPVLFVVVVVEQEEQCVLVRMIAADEIVEICAGVEVEVEVDASPLLEVVVVRCRAADQ